MLAEILPNQDGERAVQRAGVWEVWACGQALGSESDGLHFEARMLRDRESGNWPQSETWREG